MPDLQLRKKMIYFNVMATERIWTWQLILNWASRILFFVSLSALLPVMPNYIDDLGGNHSQVGVVMSSFALGVLLFRPLVGKQIDSVGRKAVLIIGTLIFIVSPFVYMFIKSVPTLIPVRVFHGLGLAAFGTASITLITDAAPLSRRGQVISYTGMINTIAFAFGPVVGVYVWENWGYNVLFGFVAGLSLLCLFLALLLRETHAPHLARNEVNYFEAIKQRHVLVSATIILLVALIHGGVMFYMPLFLKDFGVNIGLFFTVYGVSAFLIRLAVGNVSDQFGRGPIVVFSLVCLGLGVLVLSQVSGAPTMFASAVLYGTGFGSLQPTLTALVADSTTEETRGKIFSFYYGGFDLGISAAGVVLGGVAETFGIKSMFLVCVGLALLALLVFVTLIERSPAQSLKCAFRLKPVGKECPICDQYMEVRPEEVEEYFKSK